MTHSNPDYSPFREFDEPDSAIPGMSFENGGLIPADHPMNAQPATLGGCCQHIPSGMEEKIKGMAERLKLPTRHFPDTGTAAMEFLLKNHPLAKDNQELQAQNRDLRAENQELANRLEKAFQETRVVRQRAEAAEADRDRLQSIIDCHRKEDPEEQYFAPTVVQSLQGL